MDGGRLRRLTLLGAALAVALAAAAEAHQGQARLGGPTFDASGVALVARVNVSTSGVQSDSSTTGAVLSSNGRYVAFSSRATTLTPGDTNGFPDVFVHDLRELLRTAS